MSFPRKRESTAQDDGNAPPTGWIPAFAGMTALGISRVFQMTPLSTAIAVFNGSVLDFDEPAVMKLGISREIVNVHLPAAAKSANITFPKFSSRRNHAQRRETSESNHL